MHKDGPLTSKEIRYALIKGRAERLDYTKRPATCWPLMALGLTEDYINGTIREAKHSTRELEIFTYGLN